MTKYPTYRGIMRSDQDNCVYLSTKVYTLGDVLTDGASTMIETSSMMPRLVWRLSQAIRVLANLVPASEAHRFVDLIDKAQFQRFIDPPELDMRDAKLTEPGGFVPIGGHAPEAPKMTVSNATQGFEPTLMRLTAIERDVGLMNEWLDRVQKQLEANETKIVMAGRNAVREEAAGSDDKGAAYSKSLEHELARSHELNDKQDAVIAAQRKVITQQQEAINQKDEKIASLQEHNDNLHKEFAGVRSPNVPYATALPLKFVYRNHQDIISTCKVHPRRIRYGVTPYHTEPQWLMEAYDLDKQALRTFVMADMSAASRGNTETKATPDAHLRYDATTSKSVKDNDTSFASSMDAQVWAKAFMQRFGGDARHAIDEGLMLAWFANAIMRGYDEAHNKIKQDVERALLGG